MRKHIVATHGGLGDEGVAEDAGGEPCTLALSLKLKVTTIRVGTDSSNTQMTSAFVRLCVQKPL